MAYIPEHLLLDLNTPVLTHLDGTSAHGDLSELFLALMKACPKAEIYAPEGRPYPYYLAHVNSAVFAFCTSMRNITLRLPNTAQADIIADGGAPSELAGWYDFPAWGVDNLDHTKWTGRAYEHALG